MPAFVPEHLLPTLAVFANARRGWIAYSGGLDSQALLHALAGLRARLPFELRAVHVDHGLHPDSPHWTAHCRRSCERLGVPLIVRRLALAPASGESLEAVAREARYGVLLGLMGEGDLLLTAHHRDDQAETLLLALLRGSGPKGLAAMPPAAPFGPGQLVRPLLDVYRARLLAYARAQGLAWVDDPSNADLGLDRNFVRHRVLPLLAERWPSCVATIARSAGHCAEAQGLIDALAEPSLADVRGGRPGALSIIRLRALEAPLARAVLRHWIAGLGLPAPDSRHLARILGEALTERADAAPLVAWPGCEVRRYRDDLFAMAPLPPPPGREPLPWSGGALELPGGLGRLSLLDADGRPLAPPLRLAVRFGVGGLTCRTAGGHRRDLKKLFQERGIPPWLRPYIPLIFAADDLIAVGDWWICHAEGAARDRRVRWEGGIRAHPGFCQARAGS